MIKGCDFLVVTLKPALSVGPPVGPSVCRSVRLFVPPFIRPSVRSSVRPSICPSVQLYYFYFFGVFGRLLHYYSCPNTWLAFFLTAPTQQHATWEAVYPAWRLTTRSKNICLVLRAKNVCHLFFFRICIYLFSFFSLNILFFLHSVCNVLISFCNV